MNTCENTLEGEFTCSHAKLGLQYGMISSCKEDLSTNDLVQQSAPGATGTLCDVCCDMCTNEFGESCDGDPPQIDINNMTTVNCTADTVNLNDKPFFCQDAMEALNVGIIDSCQEDLTQNQVIVDLYPEVRGVRAQRF